MRSTRPASVELACTVSVTRSPSTCVLMPSRSEGFGLVGLEAIAFGVPVLVSAESGLGRVLRAVGTEVARKAVAELEHDPDRDTIREYLRRDFHPSQSGSDPLAEAYLRSAGIL